MRQLLPLRKGGQGDFIASSHRFGDIILGIHCKPMTRISRRDFIRIATLLGGVSLFAGCTLFREDQTVPPFLAGAPAVDPTEILPGVRNIYSVCGLCAGNCGIRCRVAQGTLVKIGGSPYHPASGRPTISFETDLEIALRMGGSVCAIGGAGIQALYDPFRIAVPLKRIGPRGSGKWRAISWNEALNEIVRGGNLFGEGNVAGLEAIKESGEGFDFLAGRIDWGAMTFLKRFLAEVPGARLLRDSDALMEEAAGRAADAVFGSGCGPVDADYAQARFLLSFGDAPLDSGLPLVSIARQITDARVNGPCLRWAVVDPRLSTSASRADLWVPVIPGKDAEFALAVTRALVDNYPEALRLSRDAARKLAPERSVEDLASECGVASDLPVRLAGFLAEEGPRAAAIAGRGILAQPEGVNTAEAILRLNLLVGSVPGSGGIVRQANDFLKKAEHRLLEGREQTPADQGLGNPAKALLFWQTDPVYSEPALAADFFQDRNQIPLLVAIDTQITETSALADYILPDTTYLERWDVCASPAAVTSPGFGVRTPVVGGLEPRTGRYFPVLPNTSLMEDILIAIATSLGSPSLGQHADGGIKTAFDFYRQAVPIAFQCLKEWDPLGLPKVDDPAKIFEKGGVFCSGRPKTAPSKDVPLIAQPLKSAPASRSFPADDDSLLLITYALPFHRSNRSVASSWLMEILPENRLLISVSDARRLGIGHTRRVIVESTSATARVECIAQVVPGIRPGVVALARGFGARGFGASSYVVENATVSADRTRGAGTNLSVLRTRTGPLKVTVKPV